jgi:hypothetical protein
VNHFPDDLRYSLRYLSGKHQGSEYVLDDPVEISVGRSSDSDLILVEGMVSRHHARIRMETGVLTVEDFGSTNGTYVNGEKIRARRLNEGDRVLIGTTILKVVKSRLPVGTKPPPTSTRSNDNVETAQRHAMAGTLDEVGVPELIEMFGSARQKLILAVDGGEGAANIFMSEGKVLDCRIDKLGSRAPAKKCILRVLGYNKGSFAVRPLGGVGAPYPLDIPVPELLVDGLFKLDELQVLRQRLPEAGERMVLARPLVAPLSALEDRDLDVLQLAYNHGLVSEVLDRSPELDLDAAKRLLSLIDGGYLRRA